MYKKMMFLLAILTVVSVSGCSNKKVEKIEPDKNSSGIRYDQNDSETPKVRKIQRGSNGADHTNSSEVIVEENSDKN